MKLRPYQSAAVDAVIDLYRQGCRSTILVLATGLGKTVLACELAVRLRELAPGRMMFFAHRDHLCRQAKRKLQSHTGEHVATEIADEMSIEDGLIDGSPIVVSTFQTQYKRKKRFQPKDFSIVICDEAHHLPADSFRGVVDYYRQNADMMLIGLTATPIRKDGLAMQNCFERVAYQYELIDAIRDGYLVEPRPVSARIGSLDLSAVHNQGGDLNQKELDAALKEDTIIGMVHATVEQAYGLPMYSLEQYLLLKSEDRQAKLAEIVKETSPRTTIAFCVNKAKARQTCDLFNGWVKGSAHCITDDVKGDERERIMQDHREGKFPFLCACMVPTEGYDCPRCSLIAIMRPTKSHALFAQMVGRATRPAESIENIIGDLPDNAARRAAIACSDKPDSIILDFSGNFGRHQLVRVVDVLGGTLIEADRNRAQELVAEGMSVTDALEAARMERELGDVIDDEAEIMGYENAVARMDKDATLADEVAQQNRVGTSKYKLESSHLFGTGDNHAASTDYSWGYGPTIPQVQRLVSMGWKESDAKGLTKKQASGIIGKHYAQQQKTVTT